MGRSSKRQNQKSNLSFELEELGIDIKNAGMNALTIGADIIVADAKSRINTGGTGDLANSVTWQLNRKGDRITISANARNRKSGKMYGRLLEFWPGREHPFMYPAYDANSKRVREDVIEAIRRAIRKHAMP